MKGSNQHVIRRKGIQTHNIKTQQRRFVSLRKKKSDETETDQEVLEESKTEGIQQEEQQQTPVISPKKADKIEIPPGYKLVNGVLEKKRPVGRPLGSTKKNKQAQKQTQKKQSKSHTQTQPIFTPLSLTSLFEQSAFLDYQQQHPSKQVSTPRPTKRQKKRTGEINVDNLQRYNSFGDEDFMYYSYIMKNEYAKILELN